MQGVAALLTTFNLLLCCENAPDPSPPRARCHTWKMAIRLTGAEFLSSSDSASIDLRSGCMMSLKDLRDLHA